MTLIKAGTGAQKSINPMVFIAVIGMICVITSGAFAKKGAAVNTRWYTQNPTAEVFRISTAAELAGLAQIVNGTWGGAPERDDFSGKTIRLAKNINLSDYNDWVPIGSITYDRWNNTGSRGVMWDPSNEKPFAGTFDGGGHVIRNTLGRRQSSADNKNLFGYILGGRVVNLRLDGMNIRDGDIVGHSYLYISNKAESVLPDRHSSARSSRDGGTSPILLTAVIADSVITIGAMGGFMPSIFYREFHRYITRDGLDT
ncbi:MAG: hypothetical protein LBC70_08545, partial [Chitinispirillales bacterium]|nr:hypothetical protein [Chitinispirillales bacterium]